VAQPVFKTGETGVAHRWVGSTPTPLRSRTACTRRAFAAGALSRSATESKLGTGFGTGFSAPQRMSPHFSGTKSIRAGGSQKPVAFDYCDRARPARSARSTTRARATRDGTSILRKMLRRWVSTVFWLRKSSAAISALVLRSTTSRATCSSRSVSDSSPVPSALPGRVRRWMRRPSFPSSRSAWLR
jgi:hypothetical protein